MPPLRVVRVVCCQHMHGLIGDVEVRDVVRRLDILLPGVAQRAEGCHVARFVAWLVRIAHAVKKLIGPLSRLGAAGWQSGTFDDGGRRS